MTVPGLIQPTINALPPGAQNPRHAAIIEQQNANNKLLAMTKIARGGAGQIPVPQFQMQYSQTNGEGQGVNDTIANGSQISMQSKANSIYDSQAIKKGGSNPDWKWGCYSGGKRRKHTKRRSSRKYKRKTVRRKKNRRH